MQDPTAGSGVSAIKKTAASQSSMFENALRNQCRESRKPNQLFVKQAYYAYFWIKLVTKIKIGHLKSFAIAV